MRFAKGPVKRLKEEVIPTLQLAERQFPGRDLLLRFPADGSAADALMRSPTTSVPVPIQVTCDWGHDDERRLQIMHRDGVVHGSGPILKVNGRLETKGRAYSIEDVVSDFTSIVRDRLTSKSAHGGYAPSTWLVIHINDERLPPEGLPELLKYSRTAAAAISPFAATFLVGSSDEKRVCELLSGVATL
jgi:hypothetical protein